MSVGSTSRLSMTTRRRGLRSTFLLDSISLNLLGTAICTSTDGLLLEGQRGRERITVKWKLNSASRRATINSVCARKEEKTVFLSLLVLVRLTSILSGQQCLTNALSSPRSGEECRRSSCSDIEISSWLLLSPFTVVLLHYVRTRVHTFS